MSLRTSYISNITRQTARVHSSTTATMSRPWRFAPVNPSLKGDSNSSSLKGIVFDVDGTLCEPQNYMFAEMRQALDIPKSVDILEHIESLPSPEQDEAQQKVQAIERRAMTVQKPQPGLVELMTYLEQRKVPKAICTRNFDEPVNHLLRNFIPEQLFSPIITRTFKPPKPDPAGILHIARSWSLPADERGDHLIMVGDSIDDMLAGSRAGAYTVLLLSEANEHIKDHECTNVYIKRLDQLIPILENGKLPETRIS